MISNLNSAAVQSAYASKMNDSNTTKQDVVATKQDDMSGVEKLKESINSGEYKVNLDVLSQKIADELL
ncbi:flagellar biosynthesis anti-sigma factor FlgM [Sulfurimonas sp.]|jgi:anti-sigma28 factor (negative regulator of flagellin synthesis)|uniref:flagellar biosynthesis anti-sigma factor FlgM n=1 Tax=Sulfurimonas sp. TaxID=2022749 RepID=UPI0025D11F63|nr:flagellar biosynthesis anti-sigma factor FlgM [Sulfurimonas sp.]MBT5933851.1 flagellar biosynthesis anti-sigma factor FlgM [Sulfurimonas sp.]